MAEATAMRNNALPYPIYGAPYVIVFPLLDADGDPVSPSSPDSEISKNGDTFADCTNEATEIATSSGVCYLSLTATELTTDVATIQAKSTGAKTTVSVLYPRKLVTVRSGTSASGGVSTSTIVLDGSASAIDDFYNGMVCIATIDSNVEVRVISDYTGSNQTASVSPDWNVAPDNNDTFVIKLPEGVQIMSANLTHIAGSAVSTTTAQLGVNTVQAGGTAWASGAITANSIASDAITAAKIATGAIDADAIADNAIDAGALAADCITAAKIATGAIDADAFAANAITAAKVAADVSAEIADAVWDEDTTGHTTSGTFGEQLKTDVDAILVDTGTTLDGKIDTIDTNVDSILVDTAEIGAAGAGLSAVPWNAAWDAQVESEVTDALNAYDPPTKAELDAAVANVSVDEIQATALADLFNTDSGTTYASAVAGSPVKEIADNAGGSSLTASAIADEVETRTIAAVTVVNGFAADSITAAAIADNAIDAGAIAANAITSAKFANDAITAAKLHADVTTELQSGLATAANLTTVDTVVDAIKAVTDLLPDAGALTSLATAANLATVDTVVDGIKAVTDLLPDAGALTSLATAAALDAVDNFVDTEVNAIKTVTDALGATAAARLQIAVLTELTGTVDTTAFSPTTTEFEADDITEATADHFNGRIVIFTSGALQYQATDITDYSLASGRGHFTVTALTEAPANNGTFIIV